MKYENCTEGKWEIYDLSQGFFLRVASFVNGAAEIAFEITFNKMLNADCPSLKIAY